MDPCLKSFWSLDITTTQKFMEDILTGIPQVTVKDVRISGTAKPEFHSKQTTFTYDAFTVAVVINGKAHWRRLQGFRKRLFRDIVPFLHQRDGDCRGKRAVTGVDTKFDLAPGGGYFSNGKATYTCQGDKMTLKPIRSPKTKNGVLSWGPYLYNAD
ncbi:hypothetical protein FOVG_16379 [Fusarium oxysporum f. sp. pisi HDV247]|uniref:Uncharacterized protein n=1 Tax=Fusarium oxysporum f. sp. pisi HDV247 TaxID=1080344 RepID=W9NX76_FUSOX|nr:hypothetical protein FOVG_16379 [Fusarium oxysporum f. sp. pisi HDV247]